jgi:hypothetical protein
MVPVLDELPIVRPLPAVVDVMALLMFTVKLEVFPTMVSEPLVIALVISVTLTVEFAVTIKVPEEIDQPEPELAADEMVRVCAMAPPVAVRKAISRKTTFAKVIRLKNPENEETECVI